MRLFTPNPTVSFRSCREINSYLVRATLYPVQRSVKSFECQIYLYVIETDSFSSTVTEETYRINHRFDCMEK